MNNIENNNYRSLSTLNCTIEDFSSEAQKLLKQKNKGRLYEEFGKKFLTYIPVDDRSEDNISLFGEFVDEAFEFFQNRQSLRRKIRISKKENSLSIMIIIGNRPFIVDSLNCVISKFGLQTVFIFHPVMFSQRDKDGNLVDILTNGDESARESLVFTKAFGNFNDETIEALDTEINKVLDLIDHTYDSWQMLLNRLIDITTDIMHRKEVYEEAGLPAEETMDFLNWLQKNNFTFLGMAQFDADKMQITREDGVKEIWQDNKQELRTIIEFSKSSYYTNKLAMLGKLSKVSPVHRSTLVDYILVKHLDDNGGYKSGTIIFGLYGMALYYQSIKSVPILRGKMNYVLDESGFPLNSYNYKKLKNIIESLPRETLIQIDENDLYCMCFHMLSSMRSKKLKLFIQQDYSGSFINVIIFMPRERLTPDTHNSINKYLSEKFASEIIADNITVLAQDFAHLFATIPIRDKTTLNFSSKELEDDLIKIASNWSDNLLEKLWAEYGEYLGGIRHREAVSAFPAEYKHKFDASTTVDDLHHLEKAFTSAKTVFNLLYKSDSEFVLKIYSASPLMLSDMLPAIENLGFLAVDEQSFEVRESGRIKQSWIYEFALSAKLGNYSISFNVLKANIEIALDKIAEGVFSSDALNKLLVVSGMDWEKIQLLKALASYFHQTGVPYGRNYVQQILIKHHGFTENLVKLFEAMFDPENHSEEKAALLRSTLIEYLDSVTNSTEDKILRNMHAVIEAIVRTNFYQYSPPARNCSMDAIHNSGIEMRKNYISFKFDSARVPDLPLPRPYAEIFVYAKDFEGVHLRGGKVARGGIRWSDRSEDYRVEVLGLMKAQMTKNPVIVPVGSKGCFHINFEQGTLVRHEYMEKVIACYKNFLRGLLDLTDNLVSGKVKQPSRTVIHDEESTYLVVAADKGTATFSDYANEVSAEYGFWLGDAFASGGSLGYDHKKMAITAKGAWISAVSHFLEMGKDIQKETFTVIGIGDMSGDVFGNGMLLSRTIKLVAAFNHMHIFVDPDPDPETSYTERERLFNLPGSKWSDYNNELISKGGGVFERSAKIITISKEIQDLLGIIAGELTPEALIREILKADVDLLWNGGIGTYIKSSLENNIDIGDRANDPLRCNGNEIRAKVICEGGNLGVSQLGRVEYALKGGRINTDFIDNSGGVDCSDHEVNIKIALNIAIASGKYTMEERNKLLYEMTPEVEKLVLLDNKKQNQAIGLAQRTPVLNIENFAQLIKDLEQEGLLDRKVEFLPDGAELGRRAVTKQGLTRPELAVLLSYSKMSVKKELANTDIAEDEYLQTRQLSYFPPIMQERFKEQIINHPLKKEIIITMAAGKLVNQIGGALISSIRKETGGQLCDIVKAHAAICELFDLDTLWERLELLDQTVSLNVKVDMFTDLVKIMRRGISWFIKNLRLPLNTLDIIAEYKDELPRITNLIDGLMASKTKFHDKIDAYEAEGVSKELASKIASLELLVSAFDIIYVARKTGAQDENVANLYFESGNLLNIDWLRKSCDAQIDESIWNRLSVQALKDDFYDKQRRLITKIITKHKNKVDLSNWINNNSQSANIFTNFVAELKLQESVNINMLILANKKFELFLRKLE